MTFEDFISWMEREMRNWTTFRTLGEIKRQFENRPPRGKNFVAKYDPRQEVMLQTIYDPETVKPNRLKVGQVRAIFERFIEASPSDKMTSSHYQIQVWRGAPDKIATPAIAAVIWYWYDNLRTFRVGQNEN